MTRDLKSSSDEKILLEEIETEEWISVVESSADLDKYAEVARNTLRKDKRVNIRISDRDLRSLKKIAVKEGLPYQTLISSILHKYVNN